MEKPQEGDNIPAGRPSHSALGDNAAARWPGPATPWHDSPQALGLRSPQHDAAVQGNMLHTFASPGPGAEAGARMGGGAPGRGAHFAGGLGPPMPAPAQLAPDAPRLRLRCPYCRSWFSRAFARLRCSTCEHCMVRLPRCQRPSWLRHLSGCAPCCFRGCATAEHSLIAFAA